MRLALVLGLLITLLVIAPVEAMAAGCFGYTFPYQKTPQGLVLRLITDTCRPKLQGYYDRNGVKYNCTQGLKVCKRA